MKNCYINGASCISAQETYNKSLLTDIVQNNTDNVFFAKEPSYKNIIPPAMIRRMAKGVKMSIAASNKALAEANIEKPDAIITGTGMGCLQDSDKFLKAIIDNNEEFLTPTSFIQSTHNTVGGQIAIGLQCKGYNFTYVNGAVSFESALLDAKMQIENQECTSILVGGVDETSQHTIDLLKLNGTIKADDKSPYSVLNPKTSGTVFSEGATFFVLQNEKTSTTYAKVLDVDIRNTMEEVDTGSFIKDFLYKNSIGANEIDVVLLGINGDLEYDGYYNIAQQIFANQSQVYYKHLSGEYNTASSFGVWVACNIIKHQAISEHILINTSVKSSIKKVLLYNQYKGRDHSLILLENASS